MSPSINTIEVTPSKLIELLEILFELREPAYIWGPPGIG